MNFEYDFPTTLRTIGEHAGSLVAAVSGRMEDAMGETISEIQGAYQPNRIRDDYSIEQVSGSDGTALQIVNDEAVIFESFVKGSRPHFPPWNDPDLMQWARSHGIPPFLVAKSVAEHGTPPHAEIDFILDRHEERIADSAAGGVDDWLSEAFG